MADEYQLDECELARLYDETGWTWWMADEGFFYFLLCRDRRRQARETDSIGADSSFADGAVQEVPGRPVPAAQRLMSGLGSVLLSLLSAIHLRAS